MSSLSTDLSIYPMGYGRVDRARYHALRLAGRSEDIVTTGITTAVVMVVAGINPQHAWKQPILRLLDTVVGVCVGIAGAWIVRSMTDGDRLR
jgi:uncharacterized membrane protein YccC